MEFGLSNLIGYANLDAVWPDLIDWSIINEPEIDMLSKGHTIRPGRRFKKGDQFSPRVWAGAPYRSKQVEFLPPLTVVDVFDISISYTVHMQSIIVWMNNNLLFMCLFMCPLRSGTGNYRYTCKYDLFIARADGLDVNDWIAWFPNDFTGQLICWDPEIAAQYREKIKEPNNKKIFKS